MIVVHYFLHDHAIIVSYYYNNYIICRTTNHIFMCRYIVLHYSLTVNDIDHNYYYYMKMLY